MYYIYIYITMFAPLVYSTLWRWRRRFCQNKKAAISTLAQPVLCDILGWFTAVIWLEITQNRSPGCRCWASKSAIAVGLFRHSDPGNERLQQVGLELDFSFKLLNHEPRKDPFICDCNAEEKLAEDDEEEVQICIDIPFHEHKKTWQDFFRGWVLPVVVVVVLVVIVVNLREKLKEERREKEAELSRAEFHEEWKLESFSWLKRIDAKLSYRHFISKSKLIMVI